MMKTDLHRLTGIVDINGQFIYDSPSYANAVITGSIGIGKRFEMHLGPEEEKPLQGQYGYYYKVVIELYCMQHPEFAGWTKNEIDLYLRNKCGSEVIEIRIPKKPIQLYYKLPELSKFSKKKLTQFIRDVEIHLRDEFDIHIDYKPGQ